MSKEVVRLIDDAIASTLRVLLGDLEKRCDLLRQILANLDGHEATGPGGTIEVRMAEIQDNGSAHGLRAPHPSNWREMKTSERVRWVLENTSKPLTSGEIAEAAGVEKKAVWNALSWERRKNRIHVADRGGTKSYKSK